MRILLEDLRKSSVPNLWHNALTVGILNGQELEILDEQWAALLGGKVFESTPVKIAQQKTDEEILRIESICTGCAWNKDWICEHLGCLPCAQRRIGGLKAQIRLQGSVCPAAKWQ